MFYFIEPGQFQFLRRGVLVKESVGIASLTVVRRRGCDGVAHVHWRTKNQTAVHGKDFIGGKEKKPIFLIICLTLFLLLSPCFIRDSITAEFLIDTDTFNYFLLSSFEICSITFAITEIKFCLFRLSSIAE